VKFSREGTPEPIVETSIDISGSLIHDNVVH